MRRRPPKDLIEPPARQIRCKATVELVNLFERPFRFRVEVFGQDPPFLCSRVYEIVANTDQKAAQLGIDLFCRQMSAPQEMLQIVTPTPWH
jgi:hypothetical protein